MSKTSIESLERRALFSGGQQDIAFGSNGIVTTDFGTGSDAVFNKVAVAPDGSVYAAGYSGSKLILARYTASGQLNMAFNGTGFVVSNLQMYDNSRVLAVQPDGDVLVGGQISGSALTYPNSGDAIAQYTPNGQLDPTWGVNGVLIRQWSNTISHLAAVDVSASGAIYAVGSQNSQFTVEKLLADGSPDTAYGSSGFAQVGSAGVSRLTAIDADLSPNGDVVIAGTGLVASTTSPSSYASQPEIAAFTSTGLPDTAIAGTGLETLPTNSTAATSLVLKDLLVDSHGRIVLGAAAGNYGAVVRLLPDGTLDSGFATGGYLVGSQYPGYGIGPIYAVGRLSDDGLVAAIPSDPTKVLRLTSAGVPDTSGDAPTTISVTNEYESIAVTTDDAVLLAGEHFNYTGSGINTAAVTRLTPPQSPAGNQVIGSIFEDDNGDGVKQSSEPVFTGYGISAFLDANNDGILDNGEQSVYTGGTGSFTFSNVVPGTYTLRLTNVAEANARQTLPANSGGITFTINSGDTVYTGPAFGVQPVYAVHGTVYNDTNGNAKLDSTDTGVAGRVVFADLNNNGTRDASDPFATTTSSGYYSLTLPAGTYTLREVLPPGYTETARVLGNGYGSSTFVGSGTVTLPEPASSGTPVPSYSFLSQAGGVLTVTAYNDTNNDGVQDNGEVFSGSAQLAYVDLNNNGALDAGEPNAYAVGSTGATFNLAPGTYTVRLNPKSGVITSAAAVTVTLGAAPSTAGVSFGIGTAAPSGAIRGTVYVDTNLTGTFDAYESGASGVVVYLDANGNGRLDTGETSTTTGSGGTYAFTGLAAGTYAVREVVPPNYMAVNPASARAVTLTGGGDVTGQDFGYADYRYAVVSGRVFYDANGNGAYDSGDTPMAGDIYVDTDGNGTFDAGDTLHTTSGSDGTYSLKLPATGSTYTVRFVNDRGYTPTTQSSYTITPAASTGYGGANFGYGPAPVGGASASGTVYGDANKNGKQDSTEAGLAGLTVYVDANNNAKLDSGEASTITGSGGTFTLGGLTNTGSATRLRVVLPSGYTQITPSSNYGYALTLTSGATNTGKVFGLYTPTVTPPTTATLSGFTFDDTNKNGVYDSTETKTSGKTVFLDANNNGKFDSGEKSVTTGTAGVFNFTGLAAGTYHVRRVFPSGYTQSNAPIDVTVTAGQTVSGLTIGSQSGTVTPPANTASISGFAFNDANKNGLYDGTDTLAAGKTLFIDLDDDGVLDSNEASVVTDSHGAFTFKNLAAGTYHVRRVFPSGYAESTAARYISLTAGQSATGVSIGSKAN